MPSKYRKSTSDYATKPHSGRKASPTGTDADLNLATLSHLFVDEDAARAFIEAKRWPNGPVCPHCKATEPYKLEGKKDSKNPVRPGVYKCRECRKQFTVRVGTIFEDSKIPISKWLMALHLMTSSKKGISSHQISRELGITQKSAWFVCHRIREAMKLEPMAGMLTGHVEADEAYIGARRVRKVAGSTEHKRGRGTDKFPVMVLVQRDGEAICTPIENVTAAELRKNVLAVVANDAVLITDEARHYINIGKEFGAHKTVNHGDGEYARREDGVSINTNTAESFFGLLKRGFVGAFHKMSKEHLFRYCNEFGFRWKHRKVSDGHRMVAAIKGAEGRRLMYRGPIGLAPEEAAE